MPDFPVQGRALNPGVNHNALFYTAVDTRVALAQNDTLSISMPRGMPADSHPVSVTIFGPVNNNVRTVDGDIALTSHNFSTGVTILTASGAVAAGSRVIVGYAAIGMN